MQQLSIIDELLKQFYTENNTITAAIVGGGNSAHILVNILTRHDIQTTVITRKPNKWNTDGVTMIFEGTKYIGHKFAVSDNYQYVSDADIIFLCCPVNVQIKLLYKMKAYIKPTALVGTVFGQSRFDKMVEYVLGDKQPCFAFIQIPWICRTIKYGDSVDNLGDQNVQIAFRAKDKTFLEKLDMRWIDYVHTDKSKQIEQISFVREWFFPSNNIIHPGICYGRYLVQSNNEYFYHDLSKMSGAAIDQLDVERLKVVNALNKKPYDMNINNMSIVEMWNDIWKCQGSNMSECVANDKSLQHITAGRDIQFNAKHRFFRDDIPYGLCYIKHFALLLNIETPFIDRVIRWAQRVMNIEYLNDKGELIRENLPKYYAKQSRI